MKNVVICVVMLTSTVGLFAADLHNVKSKHPLISDVQKMDRNRSPRSIDKPVGRYLNTDHKQIKSPVQHTRPHSAPQAIKQPNANT